MMKHKIKYIFIIVLFLLTSCSLTNDVFNNKNDKEDTKENTIYEISNDYFEYVGFKPRVSTEVDFTTNTSKQIPRIAVLARCEYSLFEVTVNAKLYSSDNKFLDSFTQTLNYNIAANTEFDVDDEVTAKVQAETSYVIATFTGKSYEQPDESSIKYTITFKDYNSDVYETKTVKKGQTVSKPSNPTRENYVFSMWCTDSTLNNEYDFSKPIQSDLILYAKYIVDYATLTNKITTEIMKCNVTVYSKSYNTFLGFTTSSSTSSGSGIIFYESSSGYYYLLTNNHVTVKDKEYDKVSYSVEDYKGNTYTAYLKKELASYDLAVLYFKKSTSLGVISRATTNPIVGTEVVSVGQPKGQSNAITYGKVLSFPTAPTLSCAAYESYVKFNVLKHDAETASGSSGGAILDVNLKLVGIHYAGSRSSDKFIAGYAIPIEKINEFLNNYIWGK